MNLDFTVTRGSNFRCDDVIVTFERESAQHLGNMLDKVAVLASRAGDGDTAADLDALAFALLDAVDNINATYPVV